MKGYIFKNDKGKWELGFLAIIDGEDHLYETHSESDTLGEAIGKLINAQIGA